MLPGLTIEIEGAPANGDRLIFSPTMGRAANMRFLPEVPERLAAAVATLVAPAPGNAGSGSVKMQATTVAAPPGPALSTVLGGGAGGAGAVTLLSAGVVGHIPAGTTSLSLASLGAQATADVTLTDAQAASAGTLSVTIDGTTHSFDLTTRADGTPRPAGWTTAQLAAALTAGQFETATASTNELINGDGKQMMQQFRATLKSIDRTATSLEALANDTRPAARQLSDQTIPQAEAAIRDLRATTKALRDMTERLNDQGASAVLGGQKLPDYKP